MGERPIDIARRLVQHSSTDDITSMTSTINALSEMQRAEVIVALATQAQIYRDMLFPADREEGTK